MLVRQQRGTNMRYQGYTLMSLLLSLSLSSLLLFTLVSFYSQSQYQNKTLLLRLQLQFELQHVMQLIVKDLRRAGFRAFSEKTEKTNLHLFEADDGHSLQLFTLGKQNQFNCALFFYDLDMNGCVGEKFKGRSCVSKGYNNTQHIERELFGYRLNAGMIETRLTYKNGVNSRCSSSECSSYLQKHACEKGGWVDLLDKTVYHIHALRFNWLAEKQGVEVYLAGALKKSPIMTYEVSAVVPLLNSGEK